MSRAAFGGRRCCSRESGDGAWLTLHIWGWLSVPGSGTEGPADTLCLVLVLHSREGRAWKEGLPGTVGT